MLVRAYKHRERVASCESVVRGLINHGYVSNRDAVDALCDTVARLRAEVPEQFAADEEDMMGLLDGLTGNCHRDGWIGDPFPQVPTA